MHGMHMHRIMTNRMVEPTIISNDSPFHYVQLTYLKFGIQIYYTFTKMDTPFWNQIELKVWTIRSFRGNKPSSVILFKMKYNRCCLYLAQKAWQAWSQRWYSRRLTQWPEIRGVRPLILKILHVKFGKWITASGQNFWSLHTYFTDMLPKLTMTFDLWTKIKRVIPRSLSPR